MRRPLLPPALTTPANFHTFEIAGWLSLNVELTPGPRLTGADQADQTGASLPSASAISPPTVGPAGPGRSAGSQAIARAHSKRIAF